MSEHNRREFFSNTYYPFFLSFRCRQRNRGNLHHALPKALNGRSLPIYLLAISSRRLIHRFRKTNREHSEKRTMLLQMSTILRRSWYSRTQARNDTRLSIPGIGRYSTIWFKLSLFFANKISRSIPSLIIRASRVLSGNPRTSWYRSSGRDMTYNEGQHTTLSTYVSSCCSAIYIVLMDH